MGSVAGKAAVRAELLARRAALSPEVRAQAGAQLLAHLVPEIDRLLAASVSPDVPPLVAGYVPIGSEPGGADLPEALRAALQAVGGAVMLPVLLGDNDLDWARYDRPADLVTASRGLREPVGERLGVDAVTRARLMVVPALAVDRRGVRLGRGGGSYDRALARLAGAAPVVALLHDGELVDELPAEPHDRLVSAVVTPSGGWCELPCEMSDIHRSAGRSGGP